MDVGARYSFIGEFKLSFISKNPTNMGFLLKSHHFGWKMENNRLYFLMMISNYTIGNLSSAFKLSDTSSFI